MFESSSRWIMPALAPGLLLYGEAAAWSDDQEAGGFRNEVRMERVMFEFPYLPGGNERWLEVAVILATGPGAGETVEDVMISVCLATEADAADVHGFRYYKSVAEMPVLARGRSIVRFYLPPGVVLRDRIRVAPRYYCIDVSVGGALQERTAAQVGPGLRTAASVEHFCRLARDRSMAHTGVFVPIYLTPFYGIHPGDTPGFIRRSSK